MSVNWRGWLARRLGVTAHVEREMWLSAFRQGAATIIPKRADMSTAEYRAMLNEQAEPAFARLLASPPPIIEAEPPTFNELQATNDAFVQRNQAYDATL